MNNWTWMNYAVVVLWAADISLWGAILWMHARESYAERSEQARLARKARLDREKLKGPSAEALKRRAEANAARKLAASEINRIREVSR